MEFDHRKRYASTGADASHSAPAPGKQTLTQGMVQLHPAAGPSAETATTPPVPSGPRPTLQMLFGRRGESTTSSEAAAPGNAKNRARIRSLVSVAHVAPEPKAAVGAPVQRKVTINNEAAPGAPANIAASAGGAPMAPDVRTRMESSFGADFSGVRIHQGNSAAALGAEAYTQGNDVHFAPGRYQPGSAHGAELLGHELAHVVQQRDGRVQATTQARGAQINDQPDLESEADAMGARAARGEPAAGTTQSSASAHAATGGPVQRRLLPIEGNVPQEQKDFINRRLTEYGQSNAELGAILNPTTQDIVVTITLNRNAERGDQETHTQFDGARNRTWILIQLNQAQTDTPEKLASDLLHELVLHAIPAYRAHLNRAGGAPQFTEEEGDHADQGSWCEMIRLAIHGGHWDVAQAAILDCLAHSDENGFTQDEQDALELLYDRDWDGLHEAGWM